MVVRSLQSPSDNDYARRNFTNCRTPIIASTRIAFTLLLLAVAAASAAQTAAIAFLPVLVDQNALAPGPAAHDFHVASLSASYPMAALISAPFWGWLADRIDYRIILRCALLLLALTTFLFGQTSLGALYVLRGLTGIASAAVIPLALLAGSLWATDRNEQARRFTWLTAFIFLGDLAGPMLAELSARLAPGMPLVLLAGSIGLIASLVGAVGLPAKESEYPAHRKGEQLARSTTATLLVITTLAGAGLSALHVNLLLSAQPITLSREAIAWMLSLCGVGMLAAQFAQAHTYWLVMRPVGLTRFMLAVLAFAMLGSMYVQTLPTLTAVVVTIGWSAASLRLVASFWIVDRSAPASGTKLGLQHAAASIGQAAAPIGIAMLNSGNQWVVTGAIALAAAVLAASLTMLWPSKSYLAGTERNL